MTASFGGLEMTVAGETRGRQGDEVIPPVDGVTVSGGERRGNGGRGADRRGRKLEPFKRRYGSFRVDWGRAAGDQATGRVGLRRFWHPSDTIGMVETDVPGGCTFESKTTPSD
jgi:hypothetical protein